MAQRTVHLVTQLGISRLVAPRGECKRSSVLHFTAGCDDGIKTQVLLFTHDVNIFRTERHLERWVVK